MTDAGVIDTGKNNAGPTAPPETLLFACNLNSVRSPMAAGLARSLFGGAVGVDSVGVYEGLVDPFAQAVMQELELDLSGHAPKTFEDLKPGAFELIVALTPQAYEAAKEFAKDSAAVVEYWAIPNPSDVHGGRDQILESYRLTRDELRRNIERRFQI